MAEEVKTDFEEEEEKTEKEGILTFEEWRKAREKVEE